MSAAALIHNVLGGIFGNCSCQCVLVDVGLNDGQTLTTWAQTAARWAAAAGDRRKEIGRLASCELHPIRTSRHKSICYAGFEANPAFTRQLEDLQRKLRHAGVCIELFTSTAFSTSDGHATFYVQPASLNLSAVGSTLDARKPVVTAGRRARLNLTGPLEYEPHRVATRDAAAFLQSLPHSNATGGGPFVALKLDVEGFEYTLLPHLLNSSAAARALCALGAIAIEWHNGMILPSHAAMTAPLQAQLRQPPCSLVLVPWK